MAKRIKTFVAQSVSSQKEKDLNWENISSLGVPYQQGVSIKKSKSPVASCKESAPQVELTQLEPTLADMHISEKEHKEKAYFQFTSSFNIEEQPTLSSRFPSSFFLNL